MVKASQVRPTRVTRTAGSTAQVPPAASPGNLPSAILSLQRKIGNRAVQRMLGDTAATPGLDPVTAAPHPAGRQNRPPGEKSAPHVQLDRPPRPSQSQRIPAVSRQSVIMRQAKDPFGFGRKKNKAKYAAQAQQLALVHKLKLWLRSPLPTAYEIKIASLIARLSTSDLTRLERAYGQPTTEKGEWNPYQLREDIERALPNGKRIARWISEHSDLKPKATAEQADKFHREQIKQSAAQSFPEEKRRQALKKLAESGKWPPRIQGPEGDLVLDEHTKKQLELWGPWVIANFDTLHGKSLVPGQATSVLKNPHGDLAMIWLVRIGIWNRWIRLNNESVQPTAFVPGALPSERRGKIKAAQAVIPKLEAFRELFDKTSGPLSEYMKKMINERVAQLKQTIAVYQQ